MVHANFYLISFQRDYLYKDHITFMLHCEILVGGGDRISIYKILKDVIQPVISSALRSNWAVPFVLLTFGEMKSRASQNLDVRDEF